MELARKVDWFIDFALEHAQQFVSGLRILDGKVRATDQVGLVLVPCQKLGFLVRRRV